VAGRPLNDDRALDVTMTTTGQEQPDQQDDHDREYDREQQLNH
jgi:hypothetical protein